MFRNVVAGAVISMLLTGPVWAQTASPEETLRGRDRQFIERTLEHGLSQVTFGELAFERAAADPVRGFAERMVEEHGRFNDELRTIGQNLQIEPPAHLHRDDALVLERLETLEGPAFDQAYLHDRAQDLMRHFNLVTKMEAQAQDDALRQAAQNMAPILQEHLNAAQRLREELLPIAQGPVGTLPEQAAPMHEVTPQSAEPPYSDEGEAAGAR